jgi:hypothetical protein
MTQPFASPPSDRPDAPLGWPALRLALPIVLHFVLGLGVYQLGLSNAEMDRLHINGPSHLVDAYVRAAHVYGPIGVVRAYLRGESDERLYLSYANVLLHGRADLDYIAERQNDRTVSKLQLPKRAWPYRDVRVEYPPLAFLAMAPPALVSTEYPAYRRAFIVYMLFLHFANMAMAFSLLSPLGANLSRSARLRTIERALYVSLLFFAALGSVVVTRMDHIVVSATLLCLIAYAKTESSSGNARVAWAAACGALAALGVMTKIVPGLAGLAAIVMWLRSNAPDRFRCAIACASSGAIVLAAIQVGMLALAGDHYWDAYRYHALRGIQLETSYAGLLLLLHPFGVPMHIDESFGSTNLASAATVWLKPLSAVLFAVCAGLVIAQRRFRNDAVGACLLSCVLLLIFMLTNRVFSPQYLIWVAAPLCVLCALQPTQRKLWALFFAAVLLSQLIYPRGYPVLKAMHPLAIALLNVRNLLLVLFSICFLRAYSRPA